MASSSATQTLRERRLEADLEQYRLEKARLENDLRQATAKFEVAEQRHRRGQGEIRALQELVHQLEQEALRGKQEMGAMQTRLDRELRDLQDQFEIERQILTTDLEEARQREAEVRGLERQRATELHALKEVLDKETSVKSAAKKRVRDDPDAEGEERISQAEARDLRRRVKELEAENAALSVGVAANDRMNEMRKELQHAKAMAEKGEHERKLRLALESELEEVRAGLAHVRSQYARQAATLAQMSESDIHDLARYRKFLPGGPSEAAILLERLDKAQLLAQDRLHELSQLKHAPKTEEAQIKDLESQLSAASAENARLEARMAELEQRVQRSEAQRQAAERVLGSIPVEPGSVSEQASTLTAALDRANKEIAELTQHIERIEIEKERLTRLVGQGAFDPSTTRVLHMKPAFRADRKEASSAMLGGSGDPQLQQPNANVENCVRCQRLKQLFSKQIKLYKEAVFLLFGWKLEMTPEESPCLRLRSMFAPSQDDFLLYRMSPETSTVDLLETEYGAQIEPALMGYLVRGNSPPAFHAALLLELYSQQTHQAF